MDQRYVCVVLCLSCMCMLWPCTSAHGQMVQPKSRNFLAYLQGREWCPHCLNAGGIVKVSGGQIWPAGKYGYCGDAYDQIKWDIPGPLQTAYVEGQVIDVDVLLTENHLGRFDVSICNIGANPGDGQCQQLNRVDGKGGYWYLPFLADWSGGNSGREKPAYSDGSFGWYLMPTVTTDMGCSSPSGPCTHFDDYIVYRTKWQLPSGFTCRRCKLQWHYLTAHNCWPPCAPDNQDEVTCANAQVYPTCGQPQSTYPEEFWNCADVSITSKNSTASDSGPDAAAWESLISVNYAPYGTPKTYQMTAQGWSVTELPVGHPQADPVVSMPRRLAA